MASRDGKRLGKGTFGSVIVRGGYAEKQFHKLSHLIQEVVMMIYMNDCESIIDIVGYDFRKQIITSELWPMSLSKGIEKYRLDFDQKMEIFRQILVGLCHLHNRHVVHSDLKPSNILFNPETMKLVLGDLGLSSTVKYAKVRQTAPAYRHSIPIAVPTFDMFGLAVIMYDLLGKDSRKHRRLPASTLRSLISREISDPKVRDVLLLMAPDNPRNAISAKKVLLNLFGQTVETKQHVVKVFPSRVSEADSLFIKNRITQIMSEHEINRDARCYYSCMAYFNNPDNEVVPSLKYPLYMGVIMMIFSAVFGTPGFDIEKVAYVTENSYSLSQIYQALNNVIKDRNFINFIMMPDFKKEY